MRDCSIPTVRVVSGDVPDGYVIINADEFDPARHVRFEDKPRPVMKPGK